MDVKKGLIGIVFLLAFVNLTSMASAAINVSNCSTLATANTIYELNQTITADNSVSSLYCLRISANNVTLDGKGFSIINSTFNDPAVWITATNALVKNINFSLSYTQTSLIGVEADVDNATIFNNTFYSNYLAIRVWNYVNNTKIINNTFLANNQYEVYATNITILEFSGNTLENISQYGVVLSNSWNSSIYNNNFINTLYNINTRTAVKATGIVNDNLSVYNNIVSNTNLSYTFRLINATNSNVYGNNFTAIDTAVSDISIEGGSNNNVFGNLFNSTTNYYYLDFMNNARNSKSYNNSFYCNRRDDSNHGMILHSSYNITSFNNNIYNCAYGFLFHDGSSGSVVYDSYFYNNTVNLYVIDNATNHLGYNLTMLYGQDGLHFYHYSTSPATSLPNNNTFYNVFINNATEIDAGANAKAIVFNNLSYNNLVRDSIITNTQGDDFDLITLAFSHDNFLLNVSFNESRVSIGTGTNYTKKWYYSAVVNDSNGNLVENANVSMYNNSGGIVYNSLTDSSGIIYSQNLTEYYANSTARYYQTNYAVNVTKAGYSNYSVSVNLTSSINSIITLSENIVPNITLVSPASSASSTASSWTFSFNVSDDSEISSCSVYINNAAYQNTSAINKSAVNSVAVSLSVGSYSWNVNCTDSSGNTGNSSTRSFTITSASSTASSGGAPVFSPKPSDLETEYSKVLARNWEVQLKIFGESHKMKVDKIFNNSATITIYSFAQTITLYAGEEKKIDMNSDNYYDLLVRLNSVSGAYGNFTIKTINESIISLAGKEEAKYSPANESFISENRGEIQSDFFAEFKSVIFVISIILILLAVVLLIYKKKRIWNRRIRF